MYNNSFLKSIAAGVISVSLISAALYTPPMKAQGEITILSILIGGVASLFGVDFFACSFNIVFYCDEGGNVVGSSGGNSVVQDPCTSAANACGQTNTGFYNSDHSICSADTPDNSSCPPPTISTNDFYAQPNIIKSGDSTTLHWNSTNSTSCTITGTGGFSSTGGASGTVASPALTNSATFSLKCQNGAGGPTSSAAVTVTVTPKFEEK